MLLYANTVWTHSGEGVECEGRIEHAHSPKRSWGQQGKQHRDRAAHITSVWKGRCWNKQQIVRPMSM